MNGQFDTQSIASSCISRISYASQMGKKCITRVKAFVAPNKFYLKTQLIINLEPHLGKSGKVRIGTVEYDPITNENSSGYNHKELAAIKTIELQDREVRPEENILKAFSGKNPFIISLKYYYFNKLNHIYYEYLVMEYMPEDLSDLIERLKIKNIPLTLDYIRLFSKQILSALDFIHQSKCIHRNIHPKNILVDIDNYIIKIADFGMAISVNKKPLTPFTKGDPFYQAPELIIKNRNYGTSVDIWSTACVIAYLDLQKPIFGDKEHAILKQIFKIVGPVIQDPVDKDVLLNEPGSSGQLHQMFEDEELRALLTLMFNYDHRNRASAKDLMYHVFFEEKRRKK